ncbi:uncharacterized protein LOC112005164 [Quercus suber]|uniref:uncharacterized protein LOC112005164 n=1 Tax=Quercus suber TaxID=58331 RepID=UPI000CE23DCE|nr:uncharacterized protein LOC112005164 [Quercus suber]
MPRTSVKGQLLTDLVAEFAESPIEERMKKQDMDGKSIGVISLQKPLSWKGNRQVEAVNKVIVGGLKKRLDNVKEKWVEELSHVLWTYRTTPRRSIGQTPFLMTYGAETVIHLEFGFPTLRTSSFTPSNNDGLLKKSLDLIKERRENVMVQLAYYQHSSSKGMRPM